jgi:hypothetical protein
MPSKKPLRQTPRPNKPSKQTLRQARLREASTVTAKYNLERQKKNK